MWIVLGRFCCTRLSCPRLDDVGDVVAKPTNQGWFKTLIISDRNWIFAPSVTMKSLKIEKLTSYRVGNFTSGKMVGKSRSVFGVGLLKIVLSNHRNKVLSLESSLALRSTVLGPAGWSTGNPENISEYQFSCHPPSN